MPSKPAKKDPTQQPDDRRSSAVRRAAAREAGNIVHRFRIESLEPRVMLSSIAGVVWQDRNGNALRDAGEPVLGGRTIYIDANNDGTFNATERNGTTASDGSYTIAGLVTGTYLVRQVVPTGWRPIPFAGGSLSRSVTLGSGQTVSGNDFPSVVDLAGQKSIIGPIAGMAQQFYGGVAVSGSTMIIGAPNDDDHGVNAGAAYIYTLDGQGQWQQTAKLFGSNTEVADSFGSSVAIEGDYALVGAMQADRANGEVNSLGAAPDVGEAYIFHRGVDGLWTQTAKLQANDGNGSDRLGNSVALRNGVAVISAPYAAPRGQFSGAAYVFERQPNDIWVQTQKLIGADETHDNYLGAGANSIAFNNDGSSIFVSATYHTSSFSNSGSVYIFKRATAGGWEQTSELLPNDPAERGYFGTSIVVKGNVALISAAGDDDRGLTSGSVYVFRENTPGTWTQESKLTAPDGAPGDFFGSITATSGDLLAVSAQLSSAGGTLYLFRDLGNGTWSLVSELHASDQTAGSSFGQFLAASDKGIFATGQYPALGGDRGGVYVFDVVLPSYVQGTTWQDRDGDGVRHPGEPGLAGRTLYLDADDDGSLDAGEATVVSDASGNYEFTNLTPGSYSIRQVLPPGYKSTASVASDRAVRVTVTPGQTLTGVDFGSAAAFVVRGQTFSPPAGFDGDAFGSSGFAVSGNTAVVAAVTQLPGGLAPSSAMVFDRQASGQWTYVTTLISPEPVPAGQDLFGAAVAISGDTIFVAAPYLGTIGTRSGAVHVYHKGTNGQWQYVDTLAPSGGHAEDQFGWSMAASAGTVVIGAPYDDTRSTDGGAAYVYTEDGSGEWSLRTKLTAPTAGSAEHFGIAVAIDGDTIAAGAPDRSVRASRSGAVFLYHRDQIGNWAQTDQLFPTDGTDASTDRDFFGNYVALSGNVLAVGADGDNSFTGSVHVYRRDGSGHWAETTKLVSPDPAGSGFGGVALSEDLLYVSASRASQGGIVHIYRDNGSGTYLSAGQLDSLGLPAGLIRFGERLGTSGVTVISTGPGSGRTGGATPFDRLLAGYIQGTAFNDANSNGTRDAGESELAGWTVYLDTNNNGIKDSGEASIVTDASGNYHFDDLVTGSYVVRLVQQDEWSQTLPTLGDAQRVMLAPGQTFIGDFGLVNQATVVSGIVWNDRNADGARQSNVEPLLSGRTVYWDVNANGVIDAGEPASVTDANGAWSIRNVLPGVRQFRQVVPLVGDWRNVFPSAGASASINVAPGVTNSGVAFGSAQERLALLQKLSGSDTVAGDAFGNAVVADDRTMFVSTKSKNGNTGAVYVYGLNGQGIWAQTQKLTASDGAAGDLFGEFLKLDGDTLLVSASYADVHGTDSGAVYAFHRGANGLWTQEAKLSPSDGAAANYFGQAMAVQGDTAAIGNGWESPNGIVKSGAAYVFRRSATGAWTQEFKLTPSDPAPNQLFGNLGIALQGNTLAVGAEKDGDHGSLYVFERGPSGSWTQRQKMIGSDTVFGDYFSFGQITLSGDLMLVPAPYADPQGDSSGKVYIFRRDSSGTWANTGAVLPADGTPGAQFGFVSSLVDGTLVISSAQAAYVFASDGQGGVVQKSKITTPDGTASDYFGAYNALNHNDVFITAFQNGQGGVNHGAVYVYRYRPASYVQGTAFQDADNDGTRDAGESPLPNWTVWLDTDDDGVLDAGEPTRITDANGLYEFTDLAPGNFVVRQLPQTLWTQTQPASDQPYRVTLAPGQTATADFGLYATAIISGRVFTDPNGDGVQGTGDVPLQGWVVFADLNGNRQVDPDEYTTVTDVNGDYSMLNLPIRSMSIDVVDGANWGITPRTISLTQSLVQLGVNFGSADAASRTPEPVGGSVIRLGGQTLLEQEQPRVAMDAAGNFGVIWIGSAPNNFDADAYVRKFDPVGNPLTPAVDLGGLAYGPIDISMNPAGRYVVVYGGGQARVRIFAPDGSPVTGEYFLTPNRVDAGDRSVAVGMADDGSFVSTFERSPNSTYIAYRLFDAQGNPRTGEIPFDSGESAAEVSVDAAGNAVVMSDGLAYIINSSGSIVSAPIGLRATATAVRGTNRFVLASNVSGSDLPNPIKAWIYNTSGQQVAGPITLSTTGASSQSGVTGKPQLASDIAGNVLTVWGMRDINGGFNFQQPTAHRLLGRRMNSAGQPIGAEMSLVDPFQSTYTDGDSQFGPFVAGGSWNHYVVTWANDVADGYQGDVYARVFGGQGKATAHLAVDSNGNNFVDPEETSGVKNVTLRVYRNDGDSQFEPGTNDPLVTTVTTAVDGSGQLPTLNFGDYWVQLDESSPGMNGYSLYGRPNLQRIAISAENPSVNVNFPILRAFSVSAKTDDFDNNYTAGHLSLREALFLSRQQGAGLILFDPSLANQTIQLNAGRGQLTISSDLTMLGPDAGPITIDARGSSRALYVESGVNATLHNLTLTGGSATTGAGLYISDGSTVTADHLTIRNSSASQRGGGIFVAAGGQLSLQDAIVEQNTATQQGGGLFVDVEASATLNRVTLDANRAINTGGGGIYADGALSLADVTLSGNSTDRDGGALFVDAGQTTAVNVTIANNRADANADGTGSGSGIYVQAGALALANNTIIATNLRGVSTPEDVAGPLAAASSHNIFGTGAAGAAGGGNKSGTPAAPLDPALEPLDYYGGTLPVHPLRYTSVAIDTGDDAAAQSAGIAVDETGVSRFRDFDGDGSATVDIGAVEAARVLLVDSLKDEVADTDQHRSLREALLATAASPGLDTIRFSPALAVAGVITVPATLGEWVVDSNLDLQGLSSTPVVLDGLGLSRVIRISAGAVAMVSDLTIADGFSADGAGVRNDGTLALSRVLLRTSHATSAGGGIYNTGTLTVVNSTMSANQADGAGGGLFSAARSSATLTNATILENIADANNASAGTGGGISAAAGAKVVLVNSVVARNHKGSIAGPANDVAGAFDATSGYDLIGAIDGSTVLSAGSGVQYGSIASPADPVLLPLADNGGPTQTYAIDRRSPLTDAGSDALIIAADPLALDQRGLPRLRDGNGDAQPRVDVGAFEQQFPLNLPPVFTTLSTVRGAVEGVAFTLTYEQLLANSDASDPEGDPIRFRIEGVTSGSFTLNGQAVQAGVTLLGPGQSLVWTPPASIDFGQSSTASLTALSVSVVDAQDLGNGVTRPVNIEITTTAEPVNYAVLFSGGDRSDLNYPIYYQNLRRMYSILTSRYGLRPADIYVVYADGRSSGPDQPDGTSSDMSFAPNVISATRDNLRQTLVNVSQKADANDHVFVWTYDHGLGTPADPSVTGEEIIKGWGSNQSITDKELAVWLQGLKPGQDAATYGVPSGYAGIHAGATTYMFAQCFAGGMLDDLTLSSTVAGMSASNHYEASYADYFASAFADALERGYNDTTQAFAYALNADGRAQQGGVANGGNWSFNVEHPWMGGGTFPIFATARTSQNATPELRSVAPLKCPAGTTDLTITYDMLRAAADAVDPTGQAPSFRFTSVDVGQLLLPSTGAAVSLTNLTQSTIGFGQSLIWRRPAGSSGLLNALRMKLVASDGTLSASAVVVPIRIGDPTGGTAVANADSKVLQSGSVASLVDVLNNDAGTGLHVVRVGQPLHGQVSVDPATSQVRYTPAAEYLGADVFSYLIADASGNTDIAQVALTMISYDPNAQAVGSPLDAHYAATELPAPPGYAGLPTSWDWTYRQTVPNWTSTRAVDVNDNGLVLVKISRPNDAGGALNYVGSTNASYIWAAGNGQPYWNQSSDGSVVASNTQITLLPATNPTTGQPLTHNGRQILDGVEGTSIRNAGVIPDIRYLDPDNANEAGFPPIGGVWYDVGTNSNFWQDVPSNLFPVDVSPIATNSPQYLAAANLVTAAAGSRAELWQVGRDGNRRIVSLPGAGGSHRSQAVALGGVGGGEVIGWTEYAQDKFHAFVYDGTQTRDLGAVGTLAGSKANAINASGQVAGFSATNIGSPTADGVATLWSAAGSPVSLGTLGAGGTAGWSVANDINDAGTVVGASNGHAFVWSSGTMTDLNSVANGLPTGVVLTEANGINKSGQVVATGTFNGQTKAYFLDLTSSLVAKDDAAETSSRKSVDFNVLMNDPGARSIESFNTAGLQGTITTNAFTGDVHFDPGNAFTDVQPGQAPRVTQFKYTAVDAFGKKATATVTISVKALSTFYVDGAPISTPSGVDVKLSQAPSLAALNLYDGQDASVDAPDVTLVGAATGPVRGSLAWEAPTKTLHFVATGGVLAPDTYTLTLSGRTDGIVSAGGSALDGDSNDTAGGDFVRSFTVASTTHVLSMPDFARGPGQSIDVPANSAGAGLPISISDAGSLKGLTLAIDYDPALLQINAAVLDPTMPAGWTSTVNLTTPGHAILVLSGTTGNPALPAGARTLWRLAANVPLDATYRASQALRLSDITNDGTFTTVCDVALQKVAYLGDTTGNGTFSGLDASLAARVAAQLDNGFDAHSMTDPRIIADVNGNGSISPLDASDIAGAAAHFVVAGIPAIPANAPVQPLPTGPDPTVSLPAHTTLAPGAPATVSMNIDNAAGLQALDLGLTYNPGILSAVQAANVTLGTILSTAASSWTLVPNADASGHLTITAYSTDPIAAGSGELLKIAVSALASAASGSSSPLTIAGTLNEGNLQLTPISGAVDIATVAPQVQVSNRLLFYNNSKFDAFDAAATAVDAAAIATDKVALMPGKTATFANYSSFSSGITGIFIDLAGTPTGPLTTADFTFKTGTDGSAWSNAPAPTITVLPGVGGPSTTRVALTWAAGTIRNKWLQVTMLANARTGLAGADTFYFGNAVGDMGTDPTNAIVDATDYYYVRDHLRSYGNPAPVTWAADINRDGVTDATDLQLVRSSANTASTALPLIAAPQVAAAPIQSSGTVPTQTPSVETPTGETPTGQTSTGQAPSAVTPPPQVITAPKPKKVSLRQGLKFWGRG